MANTKGVFDKNALAAGWFDETAKPAGWFDGELLADAAAISVRVTWAEFEVPAAAAPSGPLLKAWNGSAWVLGTLKRWNGSAWVTGALKRWNGSAWVTA